MWCSSSATADSTEDDRTWNCRPAGRTDPMAENRVRLGGANEMAPLAAQLIMGGVPVVIGMAGRVADMTCRLFIRQLGRLGVPCRLLRPGRLRRLCAAARERRR